MIKPKDHFSKITTSSMGKVIGLRNIISHEYANIDYEIIWVVITKHLPPLKETVENIIKDLS